MIPSRLSAPTRPVHDVRSCIVERVWVETPVDTDGDGMADLIAVYIRRPLACDDGLVVPAIYVADPYMLGCDDDGYAPHPTDVELGGAQSAGTGAGDTTAPAGRGAEADSPTWPDPDPDPRARFGAEQPGCGAAEPGHGAGPLPHPARHRPRAPPRPGRDARAGVHQRLLRVLQLVRLRHRVRRRPWHARLTGVQRLRVFSQVGVSCFVTNFFRFSA